MPQSTALKRRIAPSVPLKLELTDDHGSKFTRDFRLSFDFNTAALIEERTGLNLLGGEVWGKISAKNLSIMLWAAVLANHPEYWTVDEAERPTNDGLEAIRSYMDLGSTDLVHDTLWNAYFISLSPDKRALLEKAREELMAAAKAGKKRPDEPAEVKETADISDGANSGQSPDTTSDSATKNSGT